MTNVDRAQDKAIAELREQLRTLQARLTDLTIFIVRERRSQKETNSLMRDAIEENHRNVKTLGESVGLRVTYRD